MASLNPSDQYSQLSAQIQQKFQVNQQTREIYEQIRINGERRWKESWESFIPVAA